MVAKGLRVLLGSVRHLGFKGAAAYYIPRAVSMATRGGCKVLPLAFYVLPVRGERLLANGKDGNLKVELLAPEAISEEAFGRPEGVVAARFAKGDSCLGVLGASGLVGFMWLSDGPVAERLVNCVFEPGPKGLVAWDYDFFIAPRYRMGRAFAKLWDGAMDHLEAAGYKATVSWIEMSNVNSIRAHLRLGARKVGWAVFITILNAQLTLSSFRPYFHWTSPHGAPMKIKIEVEQTTLG